jgi:hypothetical protein
MTMTTNNVLDVLREFLATSESRFFSLVYRTKENKLSHYVLHLNVNLRRVYENDLKNLRRYECKNDVERTALAELIASVEESLTTNFRNSAYTKLDYYTHLTKSIKFHESTLYVNAFVMQEDVIEQGTRKEVRHSEKTLAKNAIKRSCMKMTKFREFRIDMTQIDEIKINGNSIAIF